MSQPPSRPLSRRKLFAGAGTVGAAAAAATLLPGVRQDPPDAAPKAPPARGGGYHMSEHIRRYFKTTLV